jgi:sugar phosphate isomerase/epimerase
MPRAILQLVLFALLSTRLFAADSQNDYRLFARTNLVAWCIVPFDSQKRTPEARADMLQKLGFKHFAYDYRAEHIPTFDAEIDACQRHGISIDAWWFPTELNDEAKLILATLERHHITPQLWVMGGGSPVKSADEQKARIEAEVARLRPIAEAAAKIHCKVGLYNHENWFGDPDNQIAIIRKLNMPNVGIVYNFHHAFADVDRFEQIFTRIKPYLLAINVNGMVRNGDKTGQQILPIGQGNLELGWLRFVRASGWRGPIGILNHTDADAEARLRDNLDGLDWIVRQLNGETPGPRPTPRSWRPPPK